MTDPKRWADEGGDRAAVERELFRAGRRVQMPPEEKRRTWTAIAERAALIPAPPSHALPAKGAAKALAHAGGLKAIAALTVLAGAGAGAYFVAHSTLSDATRLGVAARATSQAPQEPRVDVTAAKRPQERSRDVAAAQQPQERSRDVTATQQPLERARDVTAAQQPRKRPVNVTAAEQPLERATATSRLAQEAQVVLEARDALESGDPGRALHLLDDARQDFAAGSLGQEREALTIEALARTGHPGVARERARAFLSRFPKSPHASNVRRFLSEP